MTDLVREIREWVVVEEGSIFQKYAKSTAKMSGDIKLLRKRALDHNAFLFF